MNDNTPVTAVDNTTVHAESALELLRPALNERALALFATQRNEALPTLTQFAAVYPAPTSAVEHQLMGRDFAQRLNYVVDTLDGRPHYDLRPETCDAVWQTRITGAIAPPMLVPFAGGRALLAAFLFVENTPPGEDRIPWINSIVGRSLCATPEDGRIVNPFDLPMPPSPPELSVTEALRKFGLR